MSWIRSENGEAVRPAEVDRTSSRRYVYARRNIALIEGDGERPDHYEWEELAVPREAWDAFEQATVNADAIAELAEIDAENAEMVEVLSQAVAELAEIIGGD